MKAPPRPTNRSIAKYLRKWKKLKKYRLQEEALTLLFQELCPRHDEINQVLLKVSALNDFYSTNIYDTHSVARHIKSIKPSNMIVSGDPMAVSKIARVSIGGTERVFYSFATKYCNHHHAEAYPIYDSYVHRMLMLYGRIDKFAKFTGSDLRKYASFVNVIRAFQNHYGLDQFSLREIDIFLWLAGKDYLPKRSKRPKRN
jgi:hypothetical protein